MWAGKIFFLSAAGEDRVGLTSTLAQQKKAISEKDLVP